MTKERFMEVLSLFTVEQKKQILEYLEKLTAENERAAHANSPEKPCMSSHSPAGADNHSLTVRSDFVKRKDTSK